MTTKRNKSLWNKGPAYVKNIVEIHNCIFQTIDLDNDQGNDCYIELITDQVATSFCIFAQIKSGKSYKDKSGYKIPADHNHLAYWKNHTNPVAGIVYDEITHEAFWVNISDYLSKNSQVFSQKTHIIRVPTENPLSKFSIFLEHFTSYIREYKSFENYGRSLDNFGHVNDPSICYDGFKSLYSNHRNKSSSWFYFISTFGKIKESGIHRNILGVVSNYLSSDDILWTNYNLEFLHKERVANDIEKYISDIFGVHEVEISIEFIREGVVKGTYNYLIYKILSLIQDIEYYILEITYKEQDPERRDFDFWLFIHFSQWKSKEFTVQKIDEYLDQFPNSDPDSSIIGLRRSISENQFIPIG